MPNPMLLVNYATRGLRQCGLLLGLVLVTPSCAGEGVSVGTSAGGAVLLAAAPEALQHGPSLGVKQTSAFGHFLAAQFAGHQQDLSAAATFMMDALAADPDSQHLTERAFMLAIADGRFPESVELARQVIKNDAGHEVANLTLAIEAVRNGNQEAAEVALMRIPDRGFNTVVRPLMRGWLAFAGGDLQGAFKMLTPLQEEGSFGVLYQVHAALMYDLAGRSKDAAVAFESALKRTGEASLRLSWLAGNYYARLGQSSRAAQIFQDFRDAKPETALVGPALDQLESETPPPAEVRNARGGMAEALFNIASLLAQERADLLALAHIHLALRLRPDFPVAQILMGEILQGQDRGEKAIVAYKSIPNDSPFYWLARLRIAEELERLKRTDAAISLLKLLAEERQERYEPLFQLGNLLRADERFPEAAEAYDRALERIDKPQPYHWMLFYFRGISLERSKQWERAEADLLAALELEPEQPHVMNYLAYSWVEQKVHLERAKEMLHRAVELRPTDGFIVDSLGWVFYRLGDYSEAVTYLERAVELRPQDPVINDHLGDAYWKVGRYTESRFQWRRALSLKPEADLVPTIEAKIDRGLAAKPNKI